MGHTYRELFPKESLEYDKLIERKRSLFEEMEDIPLSKLTVGELMFFINLNTKSYIIPDDLDKLEQLLLEIKRGF